MRQMLTQAQLENSTMHVYKNTHIQRTVLHINSVDKYLSKCISYKHQVISMA